MEFQLLGPLEVRQKGKHVPLGGARQQAVLSALLWRANSLATMSYLTDAVWEKPPTAPESNLRTYITTLRRRLHDLPDRADRLETQPGGYVFRVLPGELDVAEFDALADLRSSGCDDDPEGLAERLANALALWRGQPLEGLPVGSALRIELNRAVERRIETEQRYAEVLDTLGRSEEVVERLRRLVIEHPLREALWTQLIWALYRSDRRAEALDIYREARARLVEELGVEPGPRLRRLHQRLLAADDKPARPTAGAGDLGARRQLPMEIAEFTGREAELRLLDRIAAPVRAPDRTDRPVVIVAVEGMAGVGKTRLAIHAAHRFVRRGWFDEVQLWADLHGFDPERPAANPADVLDYFLRTLGVPRDEVPVDLEARAAFFRDRLAGRRALVVLDNVATEDQVCPLLPGDRGSLVLITSRRSFATLAGAVPVSLEVFTPDQSLALLATIAGHDRVAAEPDAARGIAALCGHLPIALSVAARQLRARPTWSLADLQRRLEARWRLSGRFTDQTLRPLFDVSYRILPAQQRRMFRLLGTHPDAEHTAASASALTGVPVEQVECLLESLLDEHLLQQQVPGSYRLHELIRCFALDLATAGADAPRAEAG